MPRSASQSHRSLLRYSRHGLEPTYSESPVSRSTDSESTDFDSTRSWHTMNAWHTTGSLQTIDSWYATESLHTVDSWDTVESLHTAGSLRPTWRSLFSWPRTCFQSSIDSSSSEYTGTNHRSSSEGDVTLELLSGRAMTGLEEVPATNADSESNRRSLFLDQAVDTPNTGTAEGRDTRPARTPRRRRSRSPQATEENRRFWLSHAWQAFGESHWGPELMEEPDSTPPPRLIDPSKAPPPPYSAFDAFIDHSPAERTWDERSAAYLALDYYGGENRGQLPQYSRRDPLRMPPSYEYTTKQKRRCSVLWKEIWLGVKRATKALDTGIHSKLYDELGEPRCWRVFT